MSNLKITTWPHVHTPPVLLHRLSLPFAHSLVSPSSHILSFYIRCTLYWECIIRFTTLGWLQLYLKWGLYLQLGKSLVSYIGHGRHHNYLVFFEWPLLLAAPWESAALVKCSQSLRHDSALSAGSLGKNPLNCSNLPSWLAWCYFLAEESRYQCEWVRVFCFPKLVATVFRLGISGCAG